MSCCVRSRIDGARGDAMIEMRRAQLSFGDGLITEEVSDLREHWMPYADQVLIAHAAGNGSMYGEGSYTLNVSLGDAQCWQTDLYYGESDDQPDAPGRPDTPAGHRALTPAFGRSRSSTRARCNRPYLACPTTAHASATAC